MKKKLLSLALAMSMIFALAAGCSNTGEKDELLRAVRSWWDAHGWA